MRTAGNIRFALAGAALLYAFARFGLLAGFRTSCLVLACVGLDHLRSVATGTAARSILVAAQFPLLVAVALAPAPLGFGSAVPGPMMLQTPLFVLMLTLLGSYVALMDPTIIAIGAFSLLASWFAGVWVVAHDPLTVTLKSLHLADFHSQLELMRAVNQPHYLQTDPRRDELIQGSLICLLLWYTCFRAQRLARTSAEKHAARRALAAHFSPQLIELVTETREGLAPQRRSVAVMDCDLVSFSGAAEAMAPEAVASVLSLFRATVAEAVFARDGAVLSTVGDGVTAVFGLATPPGLATAHAFDAARAVHESWSRAAVMAGAVQLPAAAIGVDTGEAQVGVVGAGRSMSLLMQGGPIGTAARLQNATRAAGVPLLLSEASSRALPPDASARLQRVTTEAGDAFAWSA